jgi:hypothetical protein
MTGSGCKKRRHTPITSEAQQGFFGAELARLKAGKGRATKMSKATLERHLKESKGKALPRRASHQHWINERKRKKRKRVRAE